MNEEYKAKAVQNGQREVIREVLKRLENLPNNLQNIHTPFDLCSCIIGKLKEYGDLEGKDFLTFNLEFAEVLIYDFGVPREKIWFNTDCKEKVAMCGSSRYKGINVMKEDFFEMLKKGKEGKKFDVICMNPPYQTKSNINDKKTQPLWHKFVSRAIETLKKDGFLVAIHPGGWRNAAGVFKDTQTLLKSKSMKFLKIHSFRDGQLVFDVAINFDYYVLQNTDKKCLTNVLFEDGIERKIDISKIEFIPNENFDEIMSLVARDNEEKVEIIRDASNFHTQHSNMSKEKQDKFQYPCVYTVKSPDNDNKPTFWYSSTRENAYHGIPKVIWANGASGVFVDKNGQYGLTQFAYAIVDKPANLENIRKALQSERFIRKIMGFKESLGDKYNRKIIFTFRKDFWKDFV